MRFFIIEKTHHLRRSSYSVRRAVETYREFEGLQFRCWLGYTALVHQRIRTGVIVAVVMAGIAAFFVVLQKKDPVERGLAYLNSAYAKYSYDDPYLQYVYPGEDLHCDLEDCTITYRLLDGYFAALLLYREHNNPPGLARQVHDAENVFQSILPEWRVAPIANVVTNPKGDGIALDTMCLVGFLTRDRALADHVLASRDEESNWIAESHYRGTPWRNIADETWCLRMLIAVGVERTATQTLIERQTEKARAFLAEGNSVADRTTVLVHMLEVFADARDERFAAAQTAFWEELKTLSHDASITDDTLLQANILLALVRTGDKGTETRRIAGRLRSLQGSDGAWRRRIGEPLAVLTTARVLTALILNEKR